MTLRPLPFAAIDIDLIYFGLAARAQRRMLALNTDVPVAAH
jgi:hypothetical protein